MEKVEIEIKGKQIEYNAHKGDFIQIAMEIFGNFTSINLVVFEEDLELNIIIRFIIIYLQDIIH